MGIFVHYYFVDDPNNYEIMVRETNYGVIGKLIY